jgi:hypothetical protein
MTPDQGQTASFQDQAQKRGLALKIVNVPQVRALYEADYALIRPDQIVAWRGNDPGQASALFSQILGKTAE